MIQTFSLRPIKIFIKFKHIQISDKKINATLIYHDSVTDH